MTRERFRFGVVLLGLIAQIVGGALVFGFIPHMVFADINSAALARQCLRLAVYSNLSMALLVAFILRYAREPRLLRCVAGGGALYHVLAGIDALRTALGLTDIVLVEPVFGPAVAHACMFLLLITAALLPEKRSAEC
jgi:hypothetical protein